MSPKVSIVMATRNAEAFLRESLDSVVGQTLPEIELICVDNASTDGTRAILEEYRQGDGRIRVIAHGMDPGLMQSRKDGVLAAAGEYILFVDADDALERNACEELYGRIREAGVDILHFGARVINAGGMGDSELAAVERFIRPHAGRLEGRAVFEACFREGKYQHTLWNKLFAAGLCQKAYRQMPDRNCCWTEDWLAYYAIAYLAGSYEGNMAGIYTNYRFGSGITGKKELSLEAFAGRCRESDVTEWIQRFLETQGEGGQYRAEGEQIRQRLLEVCVQDWLERLEAADRPRGYDCLVKEWGSADVIATLARVGRHRRSDIARGVKGAAALAVRARPIRTIGTYYHRMRNGGVERVLSKLIPLWLGMGFKVVLFTDEAPHEDDYPLPEGVERRVLEQAAEARAGQYRHRAEQWARAVAECGLDVMIYHSWLDSLLVFDLLALKGRGVPFVIHAHGVCSCLMIHLPDQFAEMTCSFGLSDGVLALSRVDLCFWAALAPRAFYLPNPLTFDLARVACSPLEGQDVLWSGRISVEKNPLDAVRIMGRVAVRVPGARLKLLGKGQDERLDEQLAAEIDRLGLQDRVVRCGYHKDVEPFFREASVYLCTSRFEGFPLSLAEAQSHGLPCVMFELPHLELYRGNPGVEAVPQGDVQGAADRIVELLQDTERRRRAGREARGHIEKVAGTDLATEWRRVFGALETGDSTRSSVSAEEETVQILLRTLLGHYQQGREVARARAAQHAQTLREVTREREAQRAQAKKLVARIQALIGERERVREEKAVLAARLKERKQQRDAARQCNRENKRLARQWKGRFEQLGQRMARLKRQYEESLSWKLTAPLRVLGRWLGRGERGGGVSGSGRGGASG